MKLAVLSDIHANLSAFETVLSHLEDQYGKIPMAVLGDIVDYGLRPNETIRLLDERRNQILVNLSGNHEQIILGNGFEKLSTDRGKQSSRLTAEVMDEASYSYIKTALYAGPLELNLEGKRCLFVHGDLSDNYWGRMDASESRRSEYASYDYIFSGHTHIPFLREELFPNQEATVFRRKTRAVFMNPGSVGQPRNHNPRTQFLIFDTETESAVFQALPYPVDKEWELYADKVDSIDRFYGDRLLVGV
ncbi:MAG: metallophosphoesterase [Clostridia bacterium]|jgi:predicted phosphodiesterase|nr:metallophosphoesterase [Clostridia bacterium]